MRKRYTWAGSTEGMAALVLFCDRSPLGAGSEMLRCRASVAMRRSAISLGFRGHRQALCDTALGALSLQMEPRAWRFQGNVGKRVKRGKVAGFQEGVEE